MLQTDSPVCGRHNYCTDVTYLSTSTGAPVICWCYTACFCAVQLLDETLWTGHKLNTFYYIRPTSLVAVCVFGLAAQRQLIALYFAAMLSFFSFFVLAS